MKKHSNGDLIMAGLIMIVVIGLGTYGLGVFVRGLFIGEGQDIIFGGLLATFMYALLRYFYKVGKAKEDGGHMGDPGGRGPGTA